MLFESFVRDSRGAALADIVAAQQAQIEMLKNELAQMRAAMELSRPPQREAMAE